MKEDHRQLNMSYVSIRREVKTDDGSRIDLQILGSDWCLLIENKIYHWQANPFKSYEAHAERMGKKTNLYSILSPDGCSTKQSWKGVSYPDYCKALRQKMPEIDSYNPLSKWQLFAREFILHMENELDNPPMKPEQATFVEKYAAELIQAQKLLQKYPDYLCSVLKEELANRLTHEVEVVANWAILIRSREHWGNAFIAFRPPTMDENDKQEFYISIYPDEGELKRGQASENQRILLEGMNYLSEHFCWATVKGFKDRYDAIKDFIPRIKLIERQPN